MNISLARFPLLFKIFFFVAAPSLLFIQIFLFIQFFIVF